jgi:hypothetical protein
MIRLLESAERETLFVDTTVVYILCIGRACLFVVALLYQFYLCVKHVNSEKSIKVPAFKCVSNLSQLM